MATSPPAPAVGKSTLTMAHVEATLAIPAVEAGPAPPRTAGQPGANGPGTARPDPVPWLIALATFAAYTTLSVARYLRLDPGSWDLGIYTQYVSQLAHLHAPVVAIRGPGFDLLGDHFQPIVALVAPFFRLFPTPVTLLVAQALLTAVSVVLLVLPAPTAQQAAILCLLVRSVRSLLPAVKAARQVLTTAVAIRAPAVLAVAQAVSVASMVWWAQPAVLAVRLHSALVVRAVVVLLAALAIKVLTVRAAVPTALEVAVAARAT